MPFIRKVLREISCPRCNAIAQERLEDRHESDIIIIQLWCDKCKLKRNLGITTRKALKLKKRQQKLRESLNRAKSPHTRSRITKEIVLLDEKIRKAELAI